MSSCEPEKCIERENYYLFSENHEYNILDEAGSSLGRKHSDETKQKISDAKNPACLPAKQAGRQGDNPKSKDQEGYINK